MITDYTTLTIVNILTYYEKALLIIRCLVILLKFINIITFNWVEVKERNISSISSDEEELVREEND